MRENVAEAKTGRPRTPEVTIENTPYRPTPRRSVQVDDTPVRKLFLSHKSSQYPQGTPCPDKVITMVKEEADTEPLREEDKPLQTRQEKVGHIVTAGQETATGKAMEGTVKTGTGRETTKLPPKEPKPSALLRSLLAIQENKEKLRLRKEAVLKTFAKRLANDFQNIERLTQMNLGETMKKVFTIVTDAIN